MNYSGVILAGGSGARIGVDKRFLQLNDKPLLLHTIERIHSLVDEVVLAVDNINLFADWGLHLAVDHYPERGVLAGMHAGLAAARGAWTLVVGGDMPLLNPALITAMLRLTLTDEVDVIVPEWQGELEPLHALYRTAICAPAAEAALQAGKRRIVAFYSEVRVQVFPQVEVARWDPEGLSFFNINTIDDWTTAVQYLNKHRAL